MVLRQPENFDDYDEDGRRKIVFSIRKDTNHQLTMNSSCWGGGGGGGHSFI